MRRLTKQLKYKGKTATLMSASCWHFGNPSVNEEGIARFIEKAKKHSWIHHGDMIEGIMKRDKRHSIEEHKETILQSMRKAEWAIEGANNTCWGILKGNHDQTPSTDIGDVIEYMCVNAKVPYLTATCFVNIQGKTGNATGFFAHGSGSCGSRTGEPERIDVNKKIWLRNRLSQFHADIKGIGHVHRFIVAEPCSVEILNMGIDDDNVSRKPELVRPGWHYAAPSMFTTYNANSDYSNYGEMALFPASDIGWIETVFNSDGSIACMREVYHTGEIKQEHTERIVG